MKLSIRSHRSDRYVFGVSQCYPWPHAYFIIVSREHIKCLTYKQLANGKVISPTCANLLIVRKDLDLDRKLIVQFVELAKRFFVGV